MAAQSYSLLVESVTGIHWKPGPLTLHRDTPNLYVAIDVDDIRAHRTHAKRDFVAKWNDVSTLLADHQSSVILLRVFHDNSLGRKDICLAKAEIEISALLGMCASKEDQKGVAVKLNHVDEAEDMPSPTLVVHLETIRHVQAGAIAIANSEDDIANLGPAVTGSCVAKVVDRVTQHGDLVSGLGTVVSKLAIIVSIGDEITKIHPYANAAWQVLTSVYKVFVIRFLISADCTFRS
ncbi:hypothetical protein K438DRAFT_1814655 [Mycena galopus ATCC 62051]|nr:hypothetical protein K438DRAFT_1814655 [Mycena galopus ATCC 62051]